MEPGNPFQLRHVQAGYFSPVSVPSVESSQLDSSNGSISRVHPGRVSDPRHLVFREPSAISQTSSRFCNTLVVCDYHSSIAADCHVFAGIEREAAGVAKRPYFRSVIRCSMGLASILNKSKPSFIRNFAKFPDFARVPIKVDW